jgi:hypothetical protein
MGTRALQRRSRAQIEVLDPVIDGRRGWLVPVIHRLIEYQRQPFAGRVNDETVRVVEYRHPGLEVRIDLERVRLIIKEQRAQRARIDHQVLAPRVAERFIGARTERAQMVAVKRFEARGPHRRPIL